MFAPLQSAGGCVTVLACLSATGYLLRCTLPLLLMHQDISPAFIIILTAALIPALQGVTGQQLLQLNDHRLLQLGVLDAAERHALLAASTQLQQEHAPQSGPAAQQPSSSTQAVGKGSMPTITERSSSGALPWPGVGSRPEDAGLAADAQPDTPSANTLSRCVYGL